MPHGHIRDGNMPGSNLYSSEKSTYLLISGISIYSSYTYIDMFMSHTNIGVFNTNGSK